MTHNMTRGNPLRLLIAFSIPLLIGNIFQQFYSMADTIIVGQTISWKALAAVGTTGAYCFLIFGFFFGLTGGLTIITGQHFGAGNHKLVKKSFATSIMLSVVISIVSTIFCLLYVRDLLEFLNVPEDIFQDSYDYLFIICLGLSGIVFYNLISSVIRALGDSKTPLFFLIIACILNIGLDFMFILWFGWGVAGVAWATVISQICAGVWCTQYALKKFRILHLHKSDWEIDYGFIWQHLRVALPMAFQFSITAIGVIIMQAELNKLGATAIGACTIASKIDQLAIQPLCSFGMAIGTFAAQNYGAKKFHRIRVGTTQISIFSCIVTIFLGFIVASMIPQFTKLFIGADQMTATPELLKYITTYIFVTMPFYFFLQLLLNYRHVLQGMGFAMVPFLAGVFELLVRAFFAAPFVRLWGFYGICFLNPSAWVAAAVVLGIWYYKKIKFYTNRYL